MTPTLPSRSFRPVAVAVAVTLLSATADGHAQLAIRAGTLHTMAGDPIADAVVVCGPDGRIAAIGKAADTPIPPGHQVLEAAVVTPGLIDAHATVGLSGILNLDRHDQEQLETSAPIQPELRAVDAYNGRDPLVKWVRELGVTTVHTGHAPGAAISGQTMIVKTDRESILDAADTVRPLAMVAATLGAAGLADGDGKSPGTRAKAIALLRSEFLKAKTYQEKLDKSAATGDGDRENDDAADGDPSKEAPPPPDRDLRLEVLAQVLRGEVPLLVTANRHHDIAAALRLQREFGFRLVLDGAAEAHLMIDEIAAAKVPVIVHPTMARPAGDLENMTFSMAARLRDAGIPFAFQSGYEGYVPKTRVVLFEAAMAAAYGLTPTQALAACTRQAAEILGIADRVGTIEVGKDADLALFDGDPLETVTHCVGTIIDGRVVSAGAR